MSVTPTAADSNPLANPIVQSLMGNIPSLDNTFGALFIGCTLAAALWGVGTLQVYIYYNNYPKDRAGLKTLVALAWILDTVQQALVCHVVYYYLVQHYFDPLNLYYYVWSLKVQSLFESLTSLLVQSFFVYRIGKLSNWNYPLMAFAGAAVLAKFGLGVAYVAKGLQYKSITTAVKHMLTISEAINGVSVATDVIIAAILVVLLARGRTAFAKTNTLINTLIMYTVETSLLTSVCSIITLACAHSMPSNFVYGAFYFLIARLYVNSMLAVLNARNSLSGKAINEMHMGEYKSSQRSQTLPYTTTNVGSTMQFKMGSQPGERSMDDHLDDEAYKANVRWQSSQGTAV